MRLPFAPPLAPMLSRAADALPGGEGWQFEPKWDGFQTLVFRDGDEIRLSCRLYPPHKSRPGSIEAHRRYSSLLTRRWRRQSGANSSLGGQNSLLAGKIQ